MEFGVRGLSTNGNYEKFRSDFNYKPGFRIFDSSFLIENKEGNKGNFFDSLQVTSSGWSSDPTGYLRVNLEKTGAYRFDANMRRVHYFNNVDNHVNVRPNEPAWKGGNTARKFGDFDLTIFPERENLRLRFGTSFYKVSGDAGWTLRYPGDEYPINREVNTGSADFRAGLDTKLAGFKMTFTGGVRLFDDDTVFVRTTPHPGVNNTDVTTLTALNRPYPHEGNTKYGIFTCHG
jgi:hypothetical protein